MKAHLTRGVRLEIYFPEDTMHKHVLVHKWLFEAARWIGISGGAMYKEVAGFGRHGELRDGGIFDDDRTVPMMACFITTPLLATQFIEYLTKEGLRLFYTMSDVDYGVMGAERS